MKQDDLKAELASWKQARRNYPGWLVLPSTNRMRLVHDTEQSLHIGGLGHALVWDKFADWPAEQRLDAWDQLNWRMERGLLPLPPHWVEKIEVVLAEVVPFAELIEGGPQFPTGDAARFKERTELRGSWVSLAIGVLRHHREFRHAAQFRLWHDRLAHLDADWDEIHHQRAYQQALWHLTFLDDASALVTAEGWQAERGSDPYWLARKAGILAELGREDEAERLTRECRKRLQGVDTGSTPFFATSRESAVLAALQFSLWGDDETRRKHNERQRVLSGIDGWDYWTELSALARPDHDYREWRERKEEEPKSFFSGYPLWRPAAPVQCFRLSEELGEPPTIRNGGGIRIHPLANALRDGFGDLAWASEDLAGTCFMRLRYDDLWEKQLDGVHAARIPDGLLADMLTGCENGWRQVDGASSHAEAGRVIHLLAGLLRCIRWRLDDAQRIDWFRRLLSLGSKEFLRADRFAAGSLKEVVEDLAKDIGDSQVMGVVGDALAFPLPSEVGFDEVFWPDPMPNYLPKNPPGYLPEDAEQRVWSLIALAPADRAALGRLAYLAQAGLLPEKAAQKLAAKVWAGDELPDLAPLRPPIFLALPEPLPGQAVRALADHYLNTAPTPFRTGLNTFTYRADDWFREVHHVSRPYRRHNQRFVSWTPADAETLLGHTETWWQSEGKELLATRGNDPFGHQIRGRMYWLRFALARAIIPSLAAGSAVAKQRLPALVEDIVATGYSMFTVLPLLLRFQIGDAGSVSDQMVRALRNPDADVAVDAMWGVIHWVEFTEDLGLPAIPHRLIEQLLIFLAARADAKAAPEAVGTIEAILDHDPSLLSPRGRELLVLALDALQIRAAYPETWHQRDGAGYANAVSLRRKAVLLASAADKAGIQDEAVAYWLDVGRTDPLSVVRQALKD
ncbi:MAG: hypothetical protein ACM31L_02680 [Actinomycetota bacterium]